MQAWRTSITAFIFNRLLLLLKIINLAQEKNDTHNLALVQD
ncbi:hypothetical protein J2W48_003569 [Flavobacterium piscis]|uniref:Uncharacterized protein n=1 Tax=Flavobacterium piscis TaxID=1114874 RepID=A0ABU1YBL2_9FLAO|nr:hypothetical protein [Flavobacterium piscis]